MKINGDMVILAREYLDWTQDQLAEKVGSSQSTIAKIEAGVRHEAPAEFVRNLASATAFPEKFFLQEGERMGFGSSAFFYRKKATMQASERRRIHSVVNLTRLAIKQLLPHVEIKAKRELPSIEIEPGGSPANVARAVRALWQVPDGPIKNLTMLLESSGVIVVRCRFNTGAIDATSMRLADMPPLIFINDAIPGDRWRYTIAHELAHLVMHWANPHEMMEVEADEFAAEFLVPEEEVRPQFARMRPLRYADFLNLKRFWLVSMQMLMRRAKDLGFLSPSQHRYQIIQMSKSGERMLEPEAIPLEAPTTLQKMISAMIDALGFTRDELAEAVNWGRRELEQLFYVSGPEQSKQLRLVR